MEFSQGDRLAQENMEESEWGSEAAPQDVTIFFLQMTDCALVQSPDSLPHGARIERAQHASPELLRWLYAVVGGPYRWYERMGWSREQWQEELSVEGSELWLLYLDGTPAGYCQLQAEVVSSSNLIRTEIEILYFGLMKWAQGRGLGKTFLQTVIQRAWNQDERHALPPVGRVWVHTCSLDGEFALANYMARGLELYGEERHQEIVLKEPLGAWEAMFAR